MSNQFASMAEERRFTASQLDRIQRQADSLKEENAKLRAALADCVTSIVEMLDLARMASHAPAHERIIERACNNQFIARNALKVTE